MANRFRPARKNSSLVRAFSLAAFHVVVSPAVAHRRDAQESRSESRKMSMYFRYPKSNLIYLAEFGLRHPKIHLNIQTYVPFLNFCTPFTFDHLYLLDVFFFTL